MSTTLLESVAVLNALIAGIATHMLPLWPSTAQRIDPAISISKQLCTTGVSLPLVYIQVKNFGKELSFVARSSLKVLLEQTSKFSITRRPSQRVAA